MRTRAITPFWVISALLLLPGSHGLPQPQQATLGVPLAKYEPAPLPVSGPTVPFWSARGLEDNPLAKEGSEGTLTSDADICIIGTGTTGVSAAYHVARSVAERPLDGAPAKVVLLEARDFCSGATGRNGGHFAPRVYQRFQDFSETNGIDEAIRAMVLEEYTTDEIVKRLKDHGKADAVDLVSEGRMILAFTEEEHSRLKGDYEAAKAAGVNVSAVRFFSKEEMQETYGADQPAVQAPANNVWPLKLVTFFYNLTRELAHDTSAFTLHLHTHTPATAVVPISSADVSPRARRWSVSTPRGSVACTSVFHATNGYASHLLPHLAGPSGIIPTRNQVISVRAAVPTANLTRYGWVANSGSEYWFPRPLDAGEAEDTPPLVILGGFRTLVDGAELYIADDSTVNPVISEALKGFLPKVFPGKYVEGREPEMEWTGIIGTTKDRDPFVGPVIDHASSSNETYKGQYISAGYSGHGMTRGYGCAEATVGMMLAEMRGEEWSVPSWLPHNYLTWNRRFD